MKVEEEGCQVSAKFPPQLQLHKYTQRLYTSLKRFISDSFTEPPLQIVYADDALCIPAGVYQ